MVTYIFPGQGSQCKGMGGTLFDEFTQLTDQASQILGYSIKELCLDDPREQLNQTQFSQPALYVVNALSYFKKMSTTRQTPDYVAGHSLGEFNALLASQCFDFGTGLKLVQKRGELMSRAPEGGMAAVLNSTEEQIRHILAENNLTDIDLANFNTPSQIVVSGAKESIARAQDFFKAKGISYIRLNTSGAFHSRYMQFCRDEFAEFLRQFTFSPLTIPVVANVTARPYQNDQVASLLANQIRNPVRWSDSIQYLLGLGEMEFIELGWNNFLTEMILRIRAEVPVSTLNRPIAIKDHSSKAYDIVKHWNMHYPIGTKVKSKVLNNLVVETRTQSFVMFGHRAVTYVQGYKGLFEVEGLTPL